VFRVVAPWLLIAPARALPIWLDLRRLERVAIDPEDPERLRLGCGATEVTLLVGETAARIAAEANAARAHAVEPTPTPRLVVLSSTEDCEPGALSGQVVELVERATLLGRFLLDHRSVSAEHALVTRDPAAGCTIRDLGATNVVRVNGVECVKSDLVDGDLVDLGHVRMYFDAGAPSDAFLRVGRHVVTVRDELSLENITLTPHGGEIQAALLALAIELAT